MHKKIGARLGKLSGKRNFKLVGIMAVYNEADIVEQVLRHGISQGIEYVVLDNGSTDGSYEICRKFLGNGVLKIERWETENYPWDKILEKLYLMSIKFRPDWLVFHDADAFLESPFKNLNLKEAIEKADREKYECIQFDNFEFWPTEKDGKSKDVRGRIKYYSWNDDYRFLAWKALPGVRIVNGHHLNKKGLRAYPEKFVMRHYKIRGYKHGIKKVFMERLPRYFNQPKDWHEQYNKFKKDKKYFVIEPKKLTKYNEDGKWNLKRKFHGWQKPHELEERLFVGVD